MSLSYAYVENCLGAYSVGARAQVDKPSAAGDQTWRIAGDEWSISVAQVIPASGSHLVKALVPVPDHLQIESPLLEHEGAWILACIIAVCITRVRRHGSVEIPLDSEVQRFEDNSFRRRHASTNEGLAWPPSPLRSRPGLTFSEIQQFYSDIGGTRPLFAFGTAGTYVEGSLVVEESETGYKTWWCERGTRFPDEHASDEEGITRHEFEELLYAGVME